VKDAARASIFGDQAVDQLDLSGFAPRPARKSTSPDRATVRRESEAAGFVSRQATSVSPAIAAPEATGGPKPPPRRRRTGRNIQLNLKVDRETADRLYRLADEHGWVLGETLEHALEALEKAVAVRSEG
jgi:hypothetical protein